jgi:hypothetical protein
MPTTIEFNTKGDWEEYASIMKTMRSIPNASIGVTVVEETAPRTDATLADVARFLEFGFQHAGTGRRVPPRPVFGPTMSDNADRYMAAIGRAVKRSMRGSPNGAYARLANSLDALSERMANDVRKNIDTDAYNYTSVQPLEPSTVDMKGHDLPWFESGALRDGIRGHVIIEADFSDSSARPGSARFKDARGRFTRIGF